MCILLNNICEESGDLNMAAKQPNNQPTTVQHYTEGKETSQGENEGVRSEGKSWEGVGPVSGGDS